MKIIINSIALVKKQITDVKTYGISELFRKFYLLIKFLPVILMDIIAIVPCLIIRLISPWFIIRIERIPATNFGDLALHTGRYYCKKKLKIDQPTKKHIDFVYVHYKDKVYNKQLVKMWKRKLNFLSGYLLNPISRINRLIPGWQNHTIANLSNGVVKFSEQTLYEECETRDIKVLDFTTEEEIYGKKMLNKFGLKEDDKFVCLAVRDGAYSLKKISARYRDWSYHDYRNTDVDTYVLAAEELAKRGYYVFRMGVVAEKAFSSKNSKIIDYANSNLRSDFMDIYLAAKCSFCISSVCYGFNDLACLFAKPIVMSHVPIGELHTFSERTFLLSKHHILKKEKRKLSLSEIFKQGAGWIYFTKNFKEKGIELIDNTPEEIKDVVMEMVESLEFNKKLNPQDEALQKTFKNLYTSNIKRFNYQKESHGGIFHGPIRSRYSTKFLRENKNWLN